MPKIPFRNSVVHSKYRSNVVQKKKEIMSSKTKNKKMS